MNGVNANCDTSLQIRRPLTNLFSNFIPQSNIIQSNIFGRESHKVIKKHMLSCLSMSDDIFGVSGLTDHSFIEDYYDYELGA